MAMGCRMSPLQGPRRYGAGSSPRRKSQELQTVHTCAQEANLVPVLRTGVSRSGGSQQHRRGFSGTECGRPFHPQPGGHEGRALVTRGPDT